MSQIDLAELSEALAPLETMLSADGYGLEIDGERSPVDIKVVAKSDACDDCLVPESVINRMITSMTQSKNLAVEFCLTMPESSH